MIPVLPSFNLTAPIRALAGFSTRVMIAEIIDEHGQPRPAYLKAFLPGSRGLAGEITGWLSANTVGLEQPEHAWIVLADPAMLRAEWPDVAWGDRAVPTWVTAELVNNNPESLVSLSSPTSRNDLRKWPDLHAAIALVEWLANHDSNGGNLIRLGPGRYAMIDWAEAFGGQWWQYEHLLRPRHVYNKLAMLAGCINRDFRANPACAVEVRLAASFHNAVLMTIESQLTDWLGLLLGRKDAQAALDFLRQRIGLRNSTWDCTPAPSTA